MLYLHSLKESAEVFKALSTPMRLRIMELIYEQEMSMNDLAEALGLTKMHKTVEMPDNDAVRGMIWHVKHLVKVEEV